MERTRKVRDGFWRSFMQAGLTEDIVQKSRTKRMIRCGCVSSDEITADLQTDADPDWGPPIDGLDMDHIETYVRPKTKMRGKWSEVPGKSKTHSNALESRRQNGNR